MTPEDGLSQVGAEVGTCRLCPRLVEWREEVAALKRKAYAGEEYWGRGVPGFGDPAAKLLILGLAPAAHGANRTGRMFTGDRSGDFLYAAMYRAGLASQPEAVARDDGLVLSRAWVTSPVKCAPPRNLPTAAERDNCAPYLHRELDLLQPRVILCLGRFAWDGALIFLGRPSPKPQFGHGAVAHIETDRVAGDLCLVGSYHVSQQNTFTGRLTEQMFDDVLRSAVDLAYPEPSTVVT